MSGVSYDAAMLFQCEPTFVTHCPQAILFCLWHPLTPHACDMASMVGCYEGYQWSLRLNERSSSRRIFSYLMTMRLVSTARMPLVTSPSTRRWPKMHERAAMPHSVVVEGGSPWSGEHGTPSLPTPLLHTPTTTPPSPTPQPTPLCLWQTSHHPHMGFQPLTTQ
jgi:hypothetical protein